MQEQIKQNERKRAVCTIRKLNKVYEHAPVIPINNQSKIVMMSDCHRGIGNWGDNFMPNQNLFFSALNYYNKRCFTYIELGDGEELWENRKLDDIIRNHSDIYWLMSRFYQDNRLYMLYGNHDMYKRSEKYVREHYEAYYCESSDCMCPLFPGIKVHEGLRLCNVKTGKEYLVVHGHQGDLMNDILWRFTAFLVRFLWKPLEIMGVNNPIRPAKNYSLQGHTQKRLAGYVQKEHIPLIVGHTHRPHLPKEGELPFYNTGSCVHPRCITALEMEQGSFTLVKWCEMTREDGSIYVGRFVLDVE